MYQILNGDCLQMLKTLPVATYPEELILPCILAGSPRGGVVLDPFNGSGTTGAVAVKNGRNYIGIELNPEYVEITETRLYDLTAQQSMFE